MDLEKDGLLGGQSLEQRLRVGTHHAAHWRSFQAEGAAGLGGKGQTGVYSGWARSLGQQACMQSRQKVWIQNNAEVIERPLSGQKQQIGKTCSKLLKARAAQLMGNMANGRNELHLGAEYGIHLVKCLPGTHRARFSFQQGIEAWWHTSEIPVLRRCSQ